MPPSRGYRHLCSLSVFLSYSPGSSGMVGLSLGFVLQQCVQHAVISVVSSVGRSFIGLFCKPRFGRILMSGINDFKI